MALASRRTVYYLALVVATTVGFTATYNVGMAVWENQPQPLYRSLEVVFQTFTTTGYGEDAPWSTVQMNVLVITMQLAGIGLILTAVDVFAVPWLREALAASAPESVSDLSEHVVVCGYTPRTDAFVNELDARDRESLLVVPDPETARDLHEDGHRVIRGDPEATGTLENARVGDAVALVVDVADDANASVALAARDTAPEVPVVTLVEDADLERYHRAAGVEDVLSPRQLLGESLAAEVPTAITTDPAEVVVGEDFELVELTVAEGSDLAGRTVGAAGLRDRYGVEVIGGWFDGEFRRAAAPGAPIEVGTHLLVAGDPAEVAALREVTSSTVRPVGAPQVVVAGFGDSGRAAYDALGGRVRPTVLDVEEASGVDVVGDARDPDVLSAAGIEDASTLLVTLGDDTTAVFTTLIARELNPDLRIVVRANEEANVRKLYRAGADYVQSLAAVSGRMLTSTVFEDEEVLTYDRRVDVVRLPAPGLAGHTLADADVGARTDATVVAVVRDGETITEFDPESFQFDADDEVVVVGTGDAVARFKDAFGG